MPTEDQLPPPRILPEQEAVENAAGFDFHHLWEFLPIARLALDAGLIFRATRHPSGEQESVTTHTVMLALAVARMSRFSAWTAELDFEKLIMYALVHDLAEARSPLGDVCTVVPLSEEERAAKNAAEREGINRIWMEMPYLGRWIERYERRDDREAKFVNWMDKVMPKLVHYLNGGQGLASMGIDPEVMKASHEGQYEKLPRGGPELFPPTYLFKEAGAAVEVKLKDAKPFPKPDTEVQWLRDIVEDLVGDHCPMHEEFEPGCTYCEAARYIATGQWG